MPPLRRIDYLCLGSLEPAKNNPKLHALDALGESFGRFGFVEPMVRDDRTGRLVVGHGRRSQLIAMKDAGLAPPIGVEVDGAEWMVPVLVGWSSANDDEAAALLLASNKLVEAGGWSRQAYEEMVDALEKRGARMEALGWRRDELDDIAAAIEARRGGAPPAPVPSLRDRFLVPPFSVLDARQGYWKDRKAAWLAIGIRSEVGRGDNLIGRSLYDIAAAGMPGTYDEKKRFIDGLKAAGKTDEEIMAAIAEAGGRSRPSFPKSGAVIDPGQGGGMADNLVAARGGSKRRGTNRAPIAKPEHVEARRSRKASARTFDTGAQLGGGNFNDQVVGKRKADAIPGGAGANAAWRKGGAKAIGTQGWVQDKIAEGDIDGGMASGQSGTSIFDPVLCELIYRWFSPLGGLVLDPFAGGSVRGVVASLLGRRYVGIDLRQEQIEANRAQGKELCAKAEARPLWVVGDSRDLAALVPAKRRQADLVFSCPPYADLERYSDDPRDLSTMGYDEFLDAYRRIIKAAVDSLRDDRFAAFVVGDVRDARGVYRDFPGDTVQAFRDAGAELYNDAILVTAIGSLPIRVGKQFVTSRKLGKTHQQVYTFIKGDPRKATEACGEIEVEFPADLIVDRPPEGAPPAAGKYGEEMA